MTAPGDATTVGSIVAYLTLHRDDWSRGVDETERDAQRLGRLSPTIRIDTNAGEIVGQLALVRAAERNVGTSADSAKPFVLNLIAALAAVAPAAVPIAGVAGGSLIGLIPVFATVALGIKGISDEFKAGALQGTKYGQDIATLQGELSTLKSVAASGLLVGVDKGLAQSKGLFGEVNDDVQTMSDQLGQIIAGAGPALVKILTDLNPLFETLGKFVADGATDLEHWATSSKGVTDFVTYVQAELPDVAKFLGEVVTLFAHLVTAAAPIGGALLGDLTALVRVLDDIPVGVLQTAIPLAIGLYVALKAYRGINAIVEGVSTAIAKIKGPLAASALSAQASSLAVQSAAADEAAGVAASKAAEADAAAEAAVDIAASVEATNSVLAEGATASAEAAIEFAAAMQAESEAAAATAADISASAAAAADAADTAGAAASAGWTAMIGPIGAVAVGLGLMISLFGGSSDAEQKAAQINDSYAESLKKSSDALAQVNIQTTLKNLKEAGAVDQAKQLNISQAQLAIAVNGTSQQYSTMVNRLQALAKAHEVIVKTRERDQGQVRTYVATTYDKQGTAAVGLIKTLKQLHGSLTQQEKDQAALAKAQKDAQTAIDGGSTAVAQQARELGTSSDAYLTAQQAAQKNTDQTKAQTLAYQLENNAVGLLQQALDGLAGHQAGILQAQTSLAGANNAVTQSFKQNHSAITGTSAAAVANQQALQGSYQAAINLAQAVGKSTGSNKEEVKSLQASKTALENQLKAQGKLTPAVQAYLDKLFDVKDVAGYLAKHPTEVDVKTSSADKKIGTLQASINHIKQGKVPGLDANSQAAKHKIQDLQIKINQIKQGKAVKLTADDEPGTVKTAEFQDAINRIRQGQIPGLTARNQAGKDAVANLQSAINRIKQGQPPIIDVDANAALGVIRTVSQELQGLSGYTVTSYLNVVQRVTAGGTAHTGGLQGRGGPPGHAAGTGSSLPGWFWVGENGPEMMRLPAGTQVKSHSEAVSAAQRAAQQAKQSAALPPVYVQNPFTGEYLLAKVATVADGAVARAGQAQQLAAAAGVRRVNQ